MVQAYAFNSAALFHIAKTASDRARDNAADAVVAIVFSVLAVESFLNEVLERLRFDPDKDKPDMDRARTVSEAADLFDKNASMALKIQILSASLSGCTMDRGAQPYQDFDLLVAVRNALVHYRPEVLSEDGEQERLRSLRGRLREKKLVPPDSPDAPPRPVFADMASPPVAEWGLDAALAMIRAVARLMPTPVGERALNSYYAIDVLGDRNAT
jgi:hypothetical protein